MELAGLKVTIDADFSKVYDEFNRANSVVKTFAKDVQSIFNAIPDLGKKFNFTSNGASQAAQDYREMARAERELAMASKELARAKEIEERAKRNAEKGQAKELDLYGQLVRDSNKLVREYYNAAASIQLYGEGAEFTADKLEELKKRANESQDVLKKIEQGAGRFHRNVGNYASGFDPLRNSIMQISREMPAFANSMQTGFMAISNNIGPLADAIQQLKVRNAELIAQGKPAESMFKALAGAVFGWQTLLSVGITLLTVYGADLVRAANNAMSAGSATSAAARYQDMYNDALKETNKSAAQQIGELKSLTAVVMSNTATREQQVEALKKLQEQNRLQLGHLTLETAQTGELARIINEQLIPAILASAKARAYSQKLNKLAEEEIELTGKQMKSIQDLHKAQTRYNKEAAKGQKSSFGYAFGASPNTDLETASIGLTKANMEVDNNTKLLIENRREQEKTAEIVGSLQGQFSNLGNGVSAASGAISKATKYTSKEIETAADAFKKYQDTIKGNEDLYILGATNYDEKLKADFNAVSSFLDELVRKFKLTAESDYVKNALFNFKDIRDEIEQIDKDSKRKKFFGDMMFKSIEKYNKQIEEANKKTRDFANSMSKISLLESEGVLNPIDATKERISTLKKRIEELILTGNALSAKEFIVNLKTEEAKAKIQEFNAQMSNILQQGANSAFSAMGESIADAINGGKGSVLKTVGNFLASILDQMGKALITFGTSIEVIQKALTLAISNPLLAGGVAIGAGVLSIAAAKLLKNALGNTKGKNFAAGGIVYGETFARVGEYSNARSNPEIIAPLDKLRSIMSKENWGGNSEQQVFIPELRIAGEDIYVAFNRHLNNRQR